MEVDLNLETLEINDKKRRSSNEDDPDVNFSYNLTDLNDAIAEDIKTQPRRSGRKKIRTQDTDISEKRRVLTKPRKLEVDSNMKEIHNYYLDRRVKRMPPSLETIFEEPRDGTLMSVKKFRRCINFSDLNNSKGSLKVKKRCMKAKKMFTFKKLGKKVGMDLLKKKLSDIEDHDNINQKDI